MHCFQWNAAGTCPGGLIEGIADWVRLRSGWVPAHWRQKTKGPWDRGYEHTGYFLDYLERRFGPGTVRRINRCLMKGPYDERELFSECCEGEKVDDLWKKYCEDVEGSSKTCEETKSESEAESGIDDDVVCVPLPTVFKG